MPDKLSYNVLDHGYIRFVEAWGHGDAGGDEGVPTDYECGIIEAARQSTQAAFRGWDDVKCTNCQGKKTFFVSGDKVDCPVCGGKGYTQPGDMRLLTSLFCNKPQHATPFEFAGMTIEVQAPIFVFREWHR